MVKAQYLNYMIKPAEGAVCGADGGANVLLLALVPVAAQHFANRLVVRSTWANRNLFPGMRYVFLLGKSKNATINERVRYEASIYGDIVQEDFEDHYRNLTIKTMSGFKWAAANCAKAKFVLKVDDDVVVNSHFLLKRLDELNHKHPRLSDTMVCNVISHGLVNRWFDSKFYIPYSERYEDYYDKYCDGPA